MEEDLIVAELWKKSGNQLRQQLKNIMRGIWQNENIPEDWKIALLHVLHKKGDKTDANQSRWNFLIAVTYKILSKALQKRVETIVDKKTWKYESGFRKGWSCAEQIQNLKTIIRDRITRSQKY